MNISEEFKRFVNEKAREVKRVIDFPFNVSLKEHLSKSFPELVKSKWDIKFIVRTDIDFEILIDDIKIYAKKVDTPFGIKYIYNLKLNCDNCNNEIEGNMIFSEILSLNSYFNRENLCNNCTQLLR